MSSKRIVVCCLWFIKFLADRLWRSFKIIQKTQRCFLLICVGGYSQSSGYDTEYINTTDASSGKYYLACSDISAYPVWDNN